MPITIKSNEFNYKDPETGDYKGIGVVAEKKTTDMVNAITAKGEDILSQIPAEYTTVENFIALPYNSELSYKIGDIVRYNNGTEQQPNDQIYKCIIDTSGTSTNPEVFDTSKWSLYSYDGVGNKSSLSDVLNFLDQSYKSGLLPIEITDTVWEPGAVSSANGSNTDTASAKRTRIRTASYLNCMQGAMSVNVDEGYKFYVMEYARSLQRYFIKSLGWRTGGLDLKGNRYYRLVLSRADNSDMDTEHLENEYSHIHIYKFCTTDSDSTTAGVPADASVVFPVKRPTVFSYLSKKRGSPVAYDPTSTYSVGDYVLYGENEDFYRCVVAITIPEEWNELHWELDPLNMNDLSDSGAYRLTQTASSKIVNAPSTGSSGTIIVLHPRPVNTELSSTYTSIQVYISGFSSNIVDYRIYNGSWLPWVQIQLKENSFYPTNETITDLNTDLDTVTTAGIYRLPAPYTWPPEAHAPSELIDTGNLIVLPFAVNSNTYVLQLFANRNEIAFRYIGQSRSYPWVQLAASEDLKYIGGKYNPLDKMTIVQGAIDSSNGRDKTSSTRWHTSDATYWKIPFGKMTVVNNDPNKKIFVFRYAFPATSAAGQEEHYLGSSGWLAQYDTFEVTYGEYIRFVIAFNDDRPVEEEDPSIDIYATSSNDEVTVDHSNQQIPILYLNGDVSEMSKENAVTLSYSIFNRTGSCTLKWQGSSSLRYPKKNYTLKLDTAIDAWKEWAIFVNGYRNKLQVPSSGLMPVPDVSKWGTQKKYCLKANWIDPSMTRNIACARLWGDVMKERTAYKQYKGTYSQSNSYVIGNVVDNAGSWYRCIANVAAGEPWDNSKWESDAGLFIYRKLYNTPNYGAVDGFPIEIILNGTSIGAYTFNIPKDAYMFDMTDTDTDAYFVCGEKNGSNGCQWKAEATCSEDDDDSPDFAIEHMGDYMTAEDLQDSLNEVIDIAVTGGTDWVNNIRQRLDIESVLDYFIFILCVNGHDGLARNILYGTFDANRIFMSAYDLDTTFGADPYGTSWFRVKNDRNQFTQAAGPSASSARHRLIYLLYRYSPELLIRRYKELRAGPLSNDNVWYQLTDFAKDIPEKLIRFNNDRWELSPGTYISNIHQYFDYYKQHCAYLDKEIDDLEQAIYNFVVEIPAEVEMYDSSMAYSVGDYALRPTNGKIYRCIVDTEAGEAHWSTNWERPHPNEEYLYVKDGLKYVVTTDERPVIGVTYYKGEFKDPTSSSNYPWLS